MSFGLKFALSLWMLVSGCAGYERYMMQGDVNRAAWDAILTVAGIVCLARVLDAVRREVASPRTCACTCMRAPRARSETVIDQEPSR